MNLQTIDILKDFSEKIAMKLLPRTLWVTLSSFLYFAVISSSVIIN